MSRAALLVLFCVAAASAAGAQVGPADSVHTASDALTATDPVLSRGEHVREHAVQARRGQTVRAVVTSDAFDTYVILKTASGEQAEDDDCTPGETTRSCAEIVADADGPVRVLVTSFRPGETGPYRLTLAVDQVVTDAAATATTALGETDESLQTGERFDRYRVALAAGERRRVLVTSDAFDPYLIVTGPAGERIEAVACEDAPAGQVCVDLDAADAGTWLVLVTTIRPGEGGPYRIDQ